MNNKINTIVTNNSHDDITQLDGSLNPSSLVISYNEGNLNLGYIDNNGKFNMLNMLNGSYIANGSYINDGNLIKYISTYYDDSLNSYYVDFNTLVKTLVKTYDLTMANTYKYDEILDNLLTYTTTSIEYKYNINTDIQDVEQLSSTIDDIKDVFKYSVGIEDRNEQFAYFSTENNKQNDVNVLSLISKDILSNPNIDHDINGDNDDYNIYSGSFYTDMFNVIKNNKFKRTTDIAYLKIAKTVLPEMTNILANVTDVNITYLIDEDEDLSTESFDDKYAKNTSYNFSLYNALNKTYFPFYDKYKLHYGLINSYLQDHFVIGHSAYITSTLFLSDVIDMGATFLKFNINPPVKEDAITKLEENKYFRYYTYDESLVPNSKKPYKYGVERLTQVLSYYRFNNCSGQPTETDLKTIYSTNFKDNDNWRYEGLGRTIIDPFQVPTSYLIYNKSDIISGELSYQLKKQNLCYEHSTRTGNYSKFILENYGTQVFTYSHVAGELEKYSYLFQIKPIECKVDSFDVKNNYVNIKLDYLLNKYVEDVETNKISYLSLEKRSVLFNVPNGSNEQLIGITEYNNLNDLQTDNITILSNVKFNNDAENTAYDLDTTTIQLGSRRYTDYLMSGKHPSSEIYFGYAYTKTLDTPILEDINGAYLVGIYNNYKNDTSDETSLYGALWTNTISTNKLENNYKIFNISESHDDTFTYSEMVIEDANLGIYKFGGATGNTTKTCVCKYETGVTQSDGTNITHYIANGTYYYLSETSVVDKKYLSIIFNIDPNNCILHKDDNIDNPDIHAGDLEVKIDYILCARNKVLGWGDNKNETNGSLLDGTRHWHQFGTIISTYRDKPTEPPTKEPMPTGTSTATATPTATATATPTPTK